MENRNLQELLKDTKILEVKGDINAPILELSISSLEHKEGFLFFAIVGENTDGHIYIDDAISKGARAIVCEKFPEEIKEGVSYVRVADTKKELVTISSNFYNNPSSRFKLIGVTGTNGKTTTVYLLHSLFTKLGIKTGMISTVGDMVGENKAITSRVTPTTPGSIALNKMFFEMAEADCKYVFMEVSSHAIHLGRMKGVEFMGGIFTNLTHDHIDFHHTFENYRDTKKNFFDNLNENSFGLFNIDDKNGEYMSKDCKARKYFYSLKNDTDFNTRLDTKLLGEFNAYNVLSVYATSVLLGQDEEKVKEILKDISGVPGRFQLVENSNSVIAIVDYAHTPDALENVLKTIQNLRKKSNPDAKIITVVGCGGDRDKEKRPQMTTIGYDNSDIIILTSDNPRTENPQDILNDMKKGLPLHFPDNKIYVISDRRDAIKKAVSFAHSGDYVLLAGKGHEKYQEVNGVRSHFDDVEEIEKIMKENTNEKL